MGESSLQLLATIAGRPVFTNGGKMQVGELETSYTGVIGAASHTGPMIMLAVITLQKQVIVFEVIEDGLKEMARHVFPKRVTCVLLPAPGEDVIIADAFGDVYKLPTKGRINICEDEALQEEHRLLGHFSSITDICLGSGVIVSADRDNKIRISRYPECYVIEAFCLGHTEFVSCLLWWRNKLVSGGGDGCIRLWNMGEQLCVCKVGNGEGEISVGKILTCAWNEDMLVFVLTDSCVLYGVNVTSKNEFGQVKELRRFDNVITGIESDNKLVFVSTKGTICKISGDGNCITTNKRKDVSVENDDCLRFGWLSRQRKKEMVEDWKGKKDKKRRYQQFIKS